MDFSALAVYFFFHLIICRLAPLSYVQRASAVAIASPPFLFLFFFFTAAIFSSFFSID